jgi:hypothetical protein
MKNWHVMTIGAVAVVGIGGAYWWMRRKRDAAVQSAMMPESTMPTQRAPIEGLLPAPQPGASVMRPAERETMSFVPGGFLGRPDIGIRRAAGAQAAAGIDEARTRAKASAYRAGVAASNIAISLADSTQTTRAARMKATELAVAAAPVATAVVQGTVGAASLAAQTGAEAARQAGAWVQAADAFAANKILGL